MEHSEVGQQQSGTGAATGKGMHINGIIISKTFSTMHNFTANLLIKRAVKNDGIQNHLGTPLRSQNIYSCTLSQSRREKPHLRYSNPNTKGLWQSFFF